MRIDLHTHSAYSDGTDTPAELVANAVAAGLDIVALTDHDTVDGWAEAADAVVPGLTLLPGAEISCMSDGRSLHILGYLFDPSHPEFEEERRRLTTDRVRRARAMVERLQDLGVPISWAAVERSARHGTVGRPHIAAAMVAAGVIPDIDSAFSPEWIGRGGRAYVEKYVLDTEHAIGLINRAGGVAVLAHALGSDGATSVDDAAALIERLAVAGLAGLEVDHPDHDDEARRRLKALAQTRGLLATGSSDYHGAHKATPLGICTTEPAVVDAIVERATGTSPIVG